jgi:hypothetical protein
MSDPRDEKVGRKEGEVKRKPRGGLPAILMFLGVLFGLVLLVESFSGSMQSARIEHDDLLWRLYTGSITKVVRHGETRLEGEFQDLGDDGRTVTAGRFVCELPHGEIDRLSPDLLDLVNRLPLRISESRLLEKLAGQAVQPQRAWVASVLDSSGSSTSTRGRRRSRATRSSATRAA